jgi:hypothetical protein
MSEEVILTDDQKALIIQCAKVMHETACCIQVMKDGFDDEDDPWPRLRTLRHDLFDLSRSLRGIGNAAQ